MTTSSSAAPTGSAGRVSLWLALALAALGLVGYVAQLSARQLSAPWYLPISGTAGVVFLGLALRRRRTVWRWIALPILLLLTGGEWILLLGARLPPYTGPVAADKPFPVFATTRADGTPFTQSDLVGTQNDAMVFFRGRW
jgi:hypothetical protein